MKRLIQYLLTVLIFIGLAYIISSFSQGSFDISVWSEQMRNDLSYICVMLWMMITAIFVGIYFL